MTTKLLLNKKIVITGASSGIGKEIAYIVAEMGATPILLARSVDKLEAISIEINQKFSVQAYYYSLDVTSFECVQKTIEQVISNHENIDVLINNAGVGYFDAFHEADFHQIEEMFHVNVLGLMACTKAVLPYLLETNEGHILNIGSQAGKIATPKSSVYSATKHAVRGFTNALRMELHETNIHVSLINPGPIRTAFFDQADKSGTYKKNVEKMMLSPEDVANRIVELIIKPKRELNLPWWMNVGSTVYQLFPRLVEKLGGKKFYQK
ncbi:SDR family NAD(P)-dependent oxidoreductase [Alkalihalobacterium alkalinitrilicum]|uniref:SDR family NAD(P)-dependent oxidoreductase n=1 Tax=Alkalihalobacterium alkalinitrilicum TaxID=427920 RepID=UPI000994B672|nr:SDR family oxidoreductase [Alkalihalobacterium alkalinitrilicum]